MIDGNSIVQGIAGRQQQALPSVVGNIDEDPDNAQRAYDLSKVTGVPSTAIYGDLDEFERQHKAMLASDIVANNPHLSDFIQRDPMHAKIANDDYGNLDCGVAEGLCDGLVVENSQIFGLGNAQSA